LKIVGATILFKQTQRPEVDPFVLDLNRSEPITTTNLLH
jgi:hypothetical protein